MDKEGYTMQEPEPEHEGARHLRNLDMEHVANIRVRGKNGDAIYAKDFLDECREHAGDVLIAFENMDPNDEKYEEVKEALQEMVLFYVESKRI